MPFTSDRLLDKAHLDSIQANLNQNSTDFLDVNELNALKNCADYATIQFVRGNLPATDFPERVLDFLEKAKRNETPQTFEEVRDISECLALFEKNPILNDVKREIVQGIRQRLANYADALGINPYNADIHDKEWANRATAFSDKTTTGNRTFQVIPNDFLQVDLPEDLPRRVQEFQKNYDFILSPLLKPFQLGTNEITAAAIADQVLRNKNFSDRQDLANFLLEKAQRYSKSKFFAEKNASDDVIYTLYDNYNARMVNEFGVLASKILQQIRMDDLNRKLQGLVEEMQEAGQITPNKSLLRLTEEDRLALFNELATIYKAKHADATWLYEMKDVPTYLNIFATDPSEKITGGYTTPNGDFYEVGINYNSLSSQAPFVSDIMKSDLLHEFRHVWQWNNPEWSVLYHSGPNKEHNIDVEVDAYGQQFFFDDLLDIPESERRLNEFRKFLKQNPPNTAKNRHFLAQWIDKFYKEKGKSSNYFCHSLDYYKRKFRK
ncbi:hypothetical protein [uncultured Fibrobacter sp.]|uniref:hypothetical protein n=1 Tax=uncultured Fibrobacter sp. TaxID=261512 RepID=UPI002804861B|nr:hypothetical protein [uncultured Fibrobacter sp.]